MRQIAILLCAAFKQQATWRLNIGFDLVLATMYFLFQMIFFDRLFEFSDGLGGWNRQFMYSIFFAYIIINFFSSAFFDSIEEFFRHVHRGKIDGHLVRPVSVISTMMLRWCNPAKIVLALAIAVAGHNMRFLNINAGASWQSATLFWLMVLISIIANISFFLMLHLPSFIWARVPPADYIQSEIRQLSILPTSLFPPKMMAMLLTFAPIACGASVAGYVLRFGIDHVAGLFGVGSATLVLGTFLLTRVTLRRWNGFGG